MRALLTLLLVSATAVQANDVRPAVDAVMVYKSDRLLVLVRRGEILRRFPIALGAEPMGHKQREGDERTPEGRYFIDWRNPDSRFYKALHISYPNQLDQFEAELAGQNPGGMVMIHGTPTAPELAWMDTRGDWTDGCIAVRNEHMDEIWRFVKDGTLIIIKP